MWAKCRGWKQDVWLEAVRLQTPENAKAVLARGVQERPTSVKLWMQVTLSLSLSSQPVPYRPPLVKESVRVFF
jgi:hypothetical protein